MAGWVRSIGYQMSESGKERRDASSKERREMIPSPYRKWTILLVVVAAVATIITERIGATHLSRSIYLLAGIVAGLIGIYFFTLRLKEPPRH